MTSGWFDDTDPLRFLHNCRVNSDSDVRFFEGPHTSLTFGALFSSMDAFRAHLDRQGVKAGDRVAVALDDDLAAVVTYVAGLWHGVTLAMLDPGATAEEAQKTLALLAPDHLLISPKSAEAWRFLQGADFATLSQIVVGEEDFAEIIQTNAPPLPPATRAFDDPHLIVLTSGTTGTPKGVVLSLRAILAQSLNMGAGIGFGRGDRMLNLFRPSQIGSIVNGALLALVHGGTLVRPFQDFAFGQNRALLEALAARPVSHFIFVPSLLSCLFRDRAAFVKAFCDPVFAHFITTAAPISDDLWQQVEEATGKVVINSFGSSEVNNVTFTARTPEAGRIGTIGALRNATCRITDAHGRDVAEGETGDLWVRSETIMTGYLDAPDLTDMVLVDGWVKTGDLAHLSDGALVYVGRGVESIISGGHTIYPNEINNLLLGHPAVSDAYTFGKPHPEWGALVAACIVRDTPDLTAPQISRFLREHLSPHKLPRKIVFVDRIPLNARGKVRIDEVQKLVS